MTSRASTHVAELSKDLARGSPLAARGTTVARATYRWPYRCAGTLERWTQAGKDCMKYLVREYSDDDLDHVLHLWDETASLGQLSIFSVGECLAALRSD